MLRSPSAVWRRCVGRLRRECAAARAPTVVLVESAPETATRYAAWLEEEFDVRTVPRSGALSAVDEADAVLVDLSDPTDSSELVDRLRQRDRGCPIATVAVDSHTPPPTESVDRHLYGPTTRRALGDVVRDLLQLRASMSWSRTSAHSLGSWSI